MGTASQLTPWFATVAPSREGLVVCSRLGKTAEVVALLTSMSGPAQSIDVFVRTEKDRARTVLGVTDVVRKADLDIRDYGLAPGVGHLVMVMLWPGRAALVDLEYSRTGHVGSCARHTEAAAASESSSSAPGSCILTEGSCGVGDEQEMRGQ